MRNSKGTERDIYWHTECRLECVLPTPRQTPGPLPEGTLETSGPVPLPSKSRTTPYRSPHLQSNPVNASTPSASPSLVINTVDYKRRPK